MPDQDAVPVTATKRARRRFRLIDDQAILDQPQLPPLVEGICSAGSFVLVHGASGQGKSFLAIDLSLSIAGNTPWQGHAVKQPGPVAYIAAEGHHGLRTRILAWKSAHGVGRDRLGVTFVGEAIDPLNPSDIDALLAQLRELPERPVLVVVDTWSACLGAGGGDEDKARDTTRALTGFQRLCRGLGAALLVVHHEGHAGKRRPRGSSALNASADTTIGVSAAGNVVTLHNAKQRDMSEFADIRLKLRTVDLDGGERSCVLEGARDVGAYTFDQLSRRAETTLAALRSVGDCGATFSSWRKATGRSETTFRRAVGELLAAGRIEKRGEGKGATYALIDVGPTDSSHHRHDTATDGNGGDHQSPPPCASPLLGDAGGCDGGKEEAARSGGAEVGS